MRNKSLKIVFYTILLLSTVYADIAQASGGEEGGNAQSPVQVIVQIIITGIVLKGISYFDLP